MLLLYIFLVSCCLPGSMGDAVEEFKANLKALVDESKKKPFLPVVFFPVPKGTFQCSHVPCQLQKTIEELKVSFKNNEARKRISLMEQNMNHITSTLKKTHTQPKNSISCDVRYLTPQRALDGFKRYFENVNENCWES